MGTREEESMRTDVSWWLFWDVAGWVWSFGGWLPLLLPEWWGRGRAQSLNLESGEGGCMRGSVVAVALVVGGGGGWDVVDGWWAVVVGPASAVGRRFPPDPRLST